MDLLKRKILDDGKVIDGNILKVDSFLNHQIDVKLLLEIGKEFRKRFNDIKITKILTVEASGISVATITAMNFNVPVIFAKKGSSKNQDDETYESEAFSFTKNKSYIMKVSKKYLNETDNVLIIDDFLANGEACLSLINIAGQAGAEISGIGIVIEKAFQDGRKKIEDLGYHVESLARIKSMKDNQIEFI
ncbi:MAG: xanthine phosphoribosyltransferase [Clostridia bacterium]|nr:xanthine phosphoribosyltransferase [Clostridia bacterium]